MADGTLGERNLRRHSRGQAYALLGCEGPPYHPNEGGAEGVEPRIRGDGGLPAGPTLTAPGRTEGSPFIPTGQPSGSPESVPSAATAQSLTACDGLHHMGSLLLAIYGGALQEGTWHGAKHGSSPSYSPAPLPESLLLAWLEYDIQFRMELAASTDRAWTSGDPWQYVACLPGQRPAEDPFDMAEAETLTVLKGKGKRPAQDEGEKGSFAAKQTPKRPRRAVCRLFNTAPRGCPYGKECIFAHRCSSCGATDDHGHLACPSSQRQPPPQRGGGFSAP